jgi:predicted nucleic acid-binding protein
MGAIVDSSVLIAIERGKIELDELLASYSDEPIAVASITASELLHGVHRAKTVTQRSRREAFVEQLLSDLPVIPFDLATARIHAGLWAELASKRVNVGAHDLLIAATALAMGYDVATSDQRSFPKIPEVKLRLW